MRTPAAPTSDAESKAASLGKSFVSSSVRFQRLAIDDADFIKGVANATPPKPAGLLGEALCFNFMLDCRKVFKYPQPRKRVGALSDERQPIFGANLLLDLALGGTQTLAGLQTAALEEAR